MHKYKIDPSKLAFNETDLDIEIIGPKIVFDNLI
jgi:hypothetical protein